MSTEPNFAEGRHRSNGDGVPQIRLAVFIAAQAFPREEEGGSTRRTPPLKLDTLGGRMGVQRGSGETRIRPAGEVARGERPVVGEEVPPNVEDQEACASHGPGLAALGKSEQ